MVVYRVAQENGACANRVSILKGTTKSRFSHIRSSVMFYSNGTKFNVQLASMQGRPHSKICQAVPEIQVSKFSSWFFSFSSDFKSYDFRPAAINPALSKTLPSFN